ncbi:MAG: DUF3800 domain-containing protein [Bacillota bacterium]
MSEVLSLKDSMYHNGKTAFIDECGGFGFDFTKEGNSKYYILCAIVVKNDYIQTLHNKMEEIKKNSGFKDTEMKSSSIGENKKRRLHIIHQLLEIKFEIILLISNKEEISEESPLRKYKKTFIKYLHSQLYDLLYHSNPKLKIIEDETGTSEFQESFKKYVESKRPENNLFNEYDFEYIDSKDSFLVQLADVIAGTINKRLINPNEPDYLEMLKGKILRIKYFPEKKAPYWGLSSPEDYKYNQDIFELSVKTCKDYINKYKHDKSDDKRAQIAVLEYLLLQITNYNPSLYTSSNELIHMLCNYLEKKVSRNYLYRRIIAPLRDSGVIIASCSHGYKIPISVNDIFAYLNQTHSVVAPMLNRVRICRDSILQSTDGNLDILNDPAFLRYKNYFE